MPRRKTYRKTKRTTTRKFVNKIAKAVLHRQLENKIYDSQLASTSVDYSGAVFNVCSGLASGAGSAGTERLGLSIKPLSLEFNFLVRGNPTSSIYQTMRVIVVQGRKEAATAPTTANILQQTGAVDSYLSSYNWPQMRLGKFKVLYDKTFAVGSSMINSNTAATAYQSSLPEQINRHKLFYKFKHNILYTSGATTVQDGGLYIMMISDVSANGPYIDGYTRLMYEDA